MIWRKSYFFIYSKTLDLLVLHPFDFIPVLLFHVSCIIVLLIPTCTHSPACKYGCVLRSIKIRCWQLFQVKDKKPICIFRCTSAPRKSIEKGGIINRVYRGICFFFLNLKWDITCKPSNMKGPVTIFLREWQRQKTYWV